MSTVPKQAEVQYTVGEI